MTTFVDTNVLLDVFLPDPHWGKKSQKTLGTAYEQGSLIINEIIYAELSPQFPEKHLLDSTLKTLGIRVIPVDSDTAYRAGKKWKQYRESGGGRSRVLTVLHQE